MGGVIARVEAPFAADNPDFGDAVKLAKEHMAAMKVSAVEGLEICEAGPRDVDHYIYEAVMVAIYGKAVWGFINQPRWCPIVVDGISCKRTAKHPGGCSAT